jgi:hypothetical protein
LPSPPDSTIDRDRHFYRNHAIPQHAAPRMLAHLGSAGNFLANRWRSRREWVGARPSRMSHCRAGRRSPVRRQCSRAHCTVLLKDIRCQASDAGATVNVDGRTCKMCSVRRARDGVECVVWEMCHSNKDKVNIHWNPPRGGASNAPRSQPAAR